MKTKRAVFWNLSQEGLLQQLETSSQGVTTHEAQERLRRSRSQFMKSKGKSSTLTLVLAQFKSPIILILLFAAGLSFFLHDATDALIILAIIFISALLGFWQERGAAHAVEKLLAIVKTKVTVLRDQSKADVPIEEIVPGDVVLLSAGTSIPGDCYILESKTLFVDEAALTGETYPVEKTAGIVSEETPPGRRTNTLFLGTHVVSGSAKAVIVLTGHETEFGKISERLKLRPPETEFERGIRRFGFLILEVTLMLVIAIFAINVYLAHPVMEAFLFSLALAVGLTPQLLPAIISVNLAHGAQNMAKHKVIVKRLSSIENFGSMDVLCSDKTGTLTEGVVKLHAALNVEGHDSEKVYHLAQLNAAFETGFLNPIDEAIRSYRPSETAGYQKLDEVPYDFIRKRLSIVVEKDGSRLMITKGALQNVLDICSQAETPEGTICDISSVAETIDHHYKTFSAQGFRMLGVAYRDVGLSMSITKDHEKDMIFSGFLVFHDPLKIGIMETLTALKALGISFKIITGDNRLVAVSVSQQMGLSNPMILTGTELRMMSDEALRNQVSQVNIFAEVEPNQKERIILALKKAGHVVGYMGDGINDASALHASDVSLSVDSAVDVAKEAADIVLLEKDLEVLVQGVREGRVTFANTLKYVFMATSANFGNMFSVAGASLFLPFLPLLPKQILLTNLMTDFPEMTIATDRVDKEMIEQPRRWNITFIRNFMITFGLLSSIFDYLTFAALLFLLHSTEIQFRTGWFIESIISASLIVFIIRSRKPLFKSKPGKYLILATLLVIIATLVFPYLPLGKLMGFQPLPLSFLLILGLIVLFYLISAEIVKTVFYKKVRF